MDEHGVYNMKHIKDLLSTTVDDQLNSARFSFIMATLLNPSDFIRVPKSLLESLKDSKAL
jgi:hypothetical protein